MHDNAFAATRLTQKHGSTGRKTNIASTFRFLEAKNSPQCGKKEL
jgi:hypothetical protein